VSVHQSTAQRTIGVEAPIATDTLTSAFTVEPAAFTAANLNAPAIADATIYASLKRALDLAVAVPALIFLAPLLLVIAALIRFDSKGPVLFRQTRLGLGGTPFAILKFRSMTVMENGDTVRQATRDDARVTGIGRFLRASSLDELPQLLNVIKGEMSIIGPRPHARAHDEMYARLIPAYTQRQNTKPGITGWAQVNGLRGETPTVDVMQKRVDFDLWYVKNANIALDIEILARTALEIFRSRNAY
jgi:putative colanic acid biosynthesis UDP-glucose lipid carrier transferase